MSSINYSSNFNSQSGSKLGKQALKLKILKSRKAVVVIIIAIFLLTGGLFLWRADYLIKKINPNGGIFSNLINSIPGVDKTLKGESDGRINLLLLGMRGEGMEGGGLLADTIMVVSVKPLENKVSMISVPRDLHVKLPGAHEDKINAVYKYGEDKGRGQGLSDMEIVISEISGLPIHYGLVINFKGFEELVDAMGGVDLHLKEEFVEPLQFKEEQVCNPASTFTVLSGNYDIKKNEKGKIVASYPLCYNQYLECGGVFTVPAGDVTLSGEQALCYVRSRKTSSDFDRARRQQEVIQQIKEKLLNQGTLTDFGKVSEFIDILGNNIITDMQLWEMKRLFEIQQSMQTPSIKQKVLEDSEEGLLYKPDNGPSEWGYYLLPRGDNYDKIKNLFNTILEEESSEIIKSAQ